MGTDAPTTERIYDELMPMFNDDGRFEPKALAVLSRSFVEMKTLPEEPDMTQAATPKRFCRNDRTERPSARRDGRESGRRRDPVRTSRISSARRATPATCGRCATPRSTSRAASCSA